jgi:hypothetical protein
MLNIVSLITIHTMTVCTGITTGDSQDLNKRYHSADGTVNTESGLYVKCACHLLCDLP